jgi:hypothetical protein
MEMAAYVGDVLSFYQDNQFQETFLQYARQANNLYELAYMFGYKPNVTGVATTNIDVYQQLPSITSGSVQVPDFSYALYFSPNSSVISNLSGSTSLSDFEQNDTSAGEAIDKIKSGTVEGNSLPFEFSTQRRFQLTQIAFEKFNFIFHTGRFVSFHKQNAGSEDCIIQNLGFPQIGRSFNLRLDGLFDVLKDNVKSVNQCFNS